MNSNNAKDFDELLRKGFKIPPRVLGKNEIEIIAKLTPALQKKYASYRCKAEAVKERKC